MNDLLPDYDPSPSGQLNLSHVPPPAWAKQLMAEAQAGTGSKETQFIRVFKCESVLKQLIADPNDPADTSHIISFSGENARREQDNLYELQIDQMLLNSQDRPKVDGLPVPSVELSSGTCKQIGSFATRKVSSVSCTATDRSGKKYELLFESDGSPITLRRIRQSPLAEEKRRARQSEQFECRSKAEVARILPRDLAAYIIRCLGRDSPAPTTDEPR